MKAKNKRMHYLYFKINPTALMFINNQILSMRFQCTDVYGCPKLLDMGKLILTNRLFGIVNQPDTYDITHVYRAAVQSFELGHLSDCVNPSFFSGILFLVNYTGCFFQFTHCQTPCEKKKKTRNDLCIVQGFYLNG